MCPESLGTYSLQRSKQSVVLGNLKGTDKNGRPLLTVKRSDQLPSKEWHQFLTCQQNNSMVSKVCTEGIPGKVLPCSIKKAKENANRAKEKETSSSVPMNNFLLEICDRQPPRENSRQECFYEFSIDDQTMVKSVCGGEEHEEENGKERGSEKQEEVESVQSETALSDIYSYPLPCQLSSQTDVENVMNMRNQVVCDFRFPSESLLEIGHLLRQLKGNQLQDFLMNNLNEQSLERKALKGALFDNQCKPESGLDRELSAHSPKEKSEMPNNAQKSMEEEDLGKEAYFQIATVCPDPETPADPDSSTDGALGKDASFQAPSICPNLGTPVEPELSPDVDLGQDASFQVSTSCPDPKTLVELEPSPDGGLLESDATPEESVCSSEPESENAPEEADSLSSLGTRSTNMKEIDLAPEIPSTLMETCFHLLQQMNSLTSVEDRMLMIFREIEIGMPVVGEDLWPLWERRPNFYVWLTQWVEGRSASNRGGSRGGGRNGQNGSSSSSGGARGAGAGGARQGGSSGAGSEPGRGNGRQQDDDRGGGDGRLPKRDNWDVSNIPEVDYKRNCETAHAHMSETVLCDILGAVGTPYWQSLDPRWLTELQRCLTLVMHDVTAFLSDSSPCRVCAVLHSLLSHFVNRQCHQPCNLCMRTFFMLQYHVDMCLSGGRRERFSRADVCYQVSLSVNFDPHILRCVTERVWRKMLKYLSKIISFPFVDDEETTDGQQQQPDAAASAGKQHRTTMVRRFTPSLTSIAEVQKHERSKRAGESASASCSLRDSKTEAAAGEADASRRTGATALPPSSSTRVVTDTSNRAANFGGARPKEPSIQIPPPTLPGDEPQPSKTSAVLANADSVFYSGGSAGDSESNGPNNSGSLPSVKRKASLPVPAMLRDYAGRAVPMSFAEVPGGFGEGAVGGDSMSSQTSQGSGVSEGEAVNDIIYNRYKPQIDREGNIDFGHAKKKAGHLVLPDSRYDTQKTYGTTGYQSMPESRPGKQIGGRGSQQLMSLEMRPVGKPGIGEMVYGTRHLLLDEVCYWGSKAKQLENLKHYQPHIREEGVILDAHKSKLKILRTRYQKNMQWRRLTHLGNGMSGKCYLAIDLTSQVKFCVKRIHLSNFEECELDIWSQLHHEHVVELFGALRHGQKIYIFAEFIDGGNLSACITSQRELNRRLSHWSALCIFQQILQVLVYFRSVGIIHEDLKADNILIRSGASDNSKGVRRGDCLGSIQIVVADFGMAQRVNNDRGRSEQSPVGAPTQWSPEKAASQGHSYAADVWAATCVLVHMLSGMPPWVRRFGNAAMLHYVIFTQSPPLQDVPENIQADVHDLIVKGFTIDPVVRPTAEQFLRHPAFALFQSVNPDVYYSTLLSSGNSNVDNKLAPEHSDKELQQILESLKMEQSNSSSPVTLAVENFNVGNGSTRSVEDLDIPTLDSRHSSGGQSSQTRGTTPGSHPNITVQVIELPGPSPKVCTGAAPRVSSKEEKVPSPSDIGQFVEYDPPSFPNFDQTPHPPGSTVPPPAESPSRWTTAVPQPSTSQVGQRPEGRGQEFGTSGTGSVGGNPPVTLPPLSASSGSAVGTTLPSRPPSASARASVGTFAGDAVSVVKNSDLNLQESVSGSKSSSPGKEEDMQEFLCRQYLQDLELQDWPDHFRQSASGLRIFTPSADQGQSMPGNSRSSSSTLTPSSANLPVFQELGLRFDAEVNPGRVGEPRSERPREPLEQDDVGMMSSQDWMAGAMSDPTAHPDYINSCELFSHCPIEMPGSPVGGTPRMGEQQVGAVMLTTSSTTRQVAGSLQVRIPVPSNLPSTSTRRTFSVPDADPYQAQKRPRYTSESSTVHSSSSRSQGVQEGSSSASTHGDRSGGSRSPFEEQEIYFRQMNESIGTQDTSEDLLCTSVPGSVGTTVSSGATSTFHISMLENNALDVQSRLEQLQKQISIQSPLTDNALDSLEFRHSDQSILCKVRVPRRKRDWRALWEIVYPKVMVANYRHITLLHPDGTPVNSAVPPGDDENVWIVAPVDESSEKCWCEEHLMMR